MKSCIIRTFCVLLLVCGVSFRADPEFLEKPDDSTLWIENGKNISSSSTRGTANAWSGELNFAPLTDGEGFSVESVSLKQYMSYRDVPLSAEYPWFVFEITGIEQKPGYACWGFGLNNRRAGQVSNPRKGYYAFNVFDGAEAAGNKSTAALRLDIYWLKLDLKYFKHG